MVTSDLMTRKEVMEYLRISNRTLYLLMKRHEFPFIRLNSKVRFRRSEIDAYLESKTVRKVGD